MTVLSESFSSSWSRALVVGGLLLAATAVLLAVLLRSDDDPRPALGGNFAVCKTLEGESARSCYAREVSRELASIGGATPNVSLSAPAGSGQVTFTSTETTAPLLCDLHARVGVIDEQVPSWLGWTESLVAES